MAEQGESLISATTRHARGLHQSAPLDPAFQAFHSVVEVHPDVAERNQHVPHADPDVERGGTHVGAKSRHVTNMTIWDVAHYSDEQKASIIASYPAHERDARSKGIPTLGSGRIFPVAEDRAHGRNVAGVA